MPQVYQTVLTSIIALFALGFIFGVYRYVYPKKSLPLFYVLILVSLLPLISILRPGAYESGDFNIHVYRTIDFYDAIRDGQLLPSWAKDLNATYGYPLFIFNYPLPYYFTSFFHLIGFSFISSMKLFLAINFLLSGVFMYLCAKKLFKSETPSFVTAILYQFAPYHLVDLHFKNAMGEIIAFTLIPLVFLLLQILWEKRTFPWVVVTAISSAALIMGHIVLAFYAIAFFSVYALFKAYTRKEIGIIFLTLSSFFLGGIFSIYVWMTPFLLSKYTVTKQFGMQQAFTDLWMLFYSPWRAGLLFQGPNGEQSPLLGYVQLLSVFILLYLLLRKKIDQKYKYDILFWLLTLISIIFFVTKYSSFFWGLVPFLSATGGSQRLLLLAAFSTSILGGYLTLILAKKRMLILAIVIIAILSTILNWGHRRVIPEITDEFLITNIWKSTSESEGHWYANSRWASKTDPWFSKLPSNNLEITEGSAQTKKLKRNSIEHTYVVSAVTPIKLRENTLFFPGWQAFDNNKKVNILPDKDGVISLQIPEGVHYLEFKYEDVEILNTLKKISVFSLSISLLYLLFYGLRKLHKVQIL